MQNLKLLLLNLQNHRQVLAAITGCKSLLIQGVNTEKSGLKMCNYQGFSVQLSEQIYHIKGYSIPSQASLVQIRGFAIKQGCDWVGYLSVPKCFFTWSNPSRCQAHLKRVDSLITKFPCFAAVAAMTRRGGGEGVIWRGRYLSLKVSLKKYLGQIQGSNLNTCICYTKFEICHACTSG